MKYSKHFTHEGITIIFDKLESNKEYPSRYVATRDGNESCSVFIDKKDIELKDILEVSETFKVVIFGYSE